MPSKTKAMRQLLSLPEMGDDGSHGALNSMFAIASVGIATLTMLETLLPAAANEVERKSRELSDHFTRLIAHAQEQEEIIQELLSHIRTLERLHPDAPKLTDRKRDRHAISSHAGIASQAVEEAAEGIIMAMQFQDRNSQVTENVASILERYRGMLEEVCSNVELLRNNTSLPGQQIDEAVEHILSSIRLSDIRNHYLDALRKARVHTDEMEVEETAVETTDEIELF